MGRRRRQGRGRGGKSWIQGLPRALCKQCHGAQCGCCCSGQYKTFTSVGCSSLHICKGPGTEQAPWEPQGCHHRNCSRGRDPHRVDSKDHSHIALNHSVCPRALSFRAKLLRLRSPSRGNAGFQRRWGSFSGRMHGSSLEDRQSMLPHTTDEDLTEPLKSV